MGSFDLKDNSLITLKESSMEEVRRRNEPKLAVKAGLLRDLVMRLNSQNKSVEDHYLDVMIDSCFKLLFLALVVLCFKFNVIVPLCMKKIKH